MPRITTGYGVGRKGSEREAFILVERVPWRVAVVESAYHGLCKLTRHYSCMLFCNGMEEWVERHTDRFETPCTPEHAAAFSQWHGWGRPFFMNDDGTQRGYPAEAEGGRFERTP